MKRVLLGIALALGVLACAAPVVAQAEPIFVVTPIYVADADDAARIGRHELVGTVTYFNLFDMRLRADGRELPVRLHQGTIINPRGMTIVPGMRIRVFGYWQDDGGFHADRIGLVR